MAGERVTEHREGLRAQQADTQTPVAEDVTGQASQRCLIKALLDIIDGCFQCCFTEISTQ